MGKVTIKDIAKIAGVSYSTVSRALNDSPEIGQETKALILKISQEQGYYVNVAARTLLTKKSNTIGLVLPDITNPFFSEIAMEIETEARRQGIHVMLSCFQNDIQQIKQVIQVLLQHSVDGIILATSDQKLLREIKPYCAMTPIVVIGNVHVEKYPELKQINHISRDEMLGTELSTKHLIDLGHRDILYFGMRKNSYTHALRMQGYTNCMKAHGLKTQIVYNQENHSSIACGSALAHTLFEQPLTFTGIVAASDSMALGVLDGADKFNLEVPRDFSMMGIDNISFSALPRINLTTIDYKKHLLSKFSLQLLLQLRDTEAQGLSVQQMIAPTLIQRKSCRAIQSE